MNPFFSPGGVFYPFRWFLLILTTLVLSMSYVDLSGWRLFTSSGNTTRGYYGGPTGHK